MSFTERENAEPNKTALQALINLAVRFKGDPRVSEEMMKIFELHREAVSDEILNKSSAKRVDTVGFSAGPGACMTRTFER